MSMMAGVGGGVQDFGEGWSSAKGWMEGFFFSFLESIVKNTYMLPLV